MGILVFVQEGVSYRWLVRSEGPHSPLLRASFPFVFSIPSFRTLDLKLGLGFRV